MPQDPPDSVSLEAWSPFAPGEVTELLAGLDVPWYVAGGWALTLFCGEQRRAHHDIEIAVPRARFAAVRARLEAFELYVAGDGQVSPLDVAAEPSPEHHQIWVRDRRSGMFRLDVFLEPADGDVWIARRDARVRRPYRELIARSRDGIPYGVPEVILLFKAKAPRAKDRADFAAVAPLLSSAQRAWLASALAIVHPGHAWLAQLGG